MLLRGLKKEGNGKMNDIFENRAVDEKQLERINRVKTQADYLYKYILEMCPGNREQSIAITKLEESVMWATKSIAHEKKGRR